MRSWMIAFCIGAASVARFAALPDVPAPVLALSAFVLAFILLKKWIWLALPSVFLLGLIWGIGFGNMRLHALLPAYLEGQDFWVRGQVTGLPQASARSVQFAFRVEESCFDLLPEDCSFASETFSNRLISINYYGDLEIRPAQRWLLRVRLNRPHGFANPGGFDYEGWLFQQGYAAKGYVRDNPFNLRLADAPFSLSLLRWHLRERLLKASAELPYAGVILALVLGDKQEVSEENWSLFTATGTNHLIVISGMHIAFIALLSYGLLNRLVRLFPGFLARFPAQKLACMGAIAGAVFYSLVAGFSVPTQRSLIMVAVFMGGQILGCRFAPSSSYCLALMLVLLLNPLSVTSAGFWLSFGAVGTLLLAFAAVRQLRLREDGAETGLNAGPVWWRVAWQRWGLPQWVVFIGMTVPLAMSLQQMSLLSPLANIVAIPLVNVLVIPPALCATFLIWVNEPFGHALLWFASHALQFTVWFLQQLQNSSSGVVLWHFFGLTPAATGFAALGSVLLLLPRGWPDKRLALFMFLPIFYPGRNELPSGIAEFTVLDVGQGLAVIVRTAGHTLVYDTGPRFSDSFDAGSGVVFPFLRQAGVKKIDHLIVSHGDNDHEGGLESLLQLLPVERLSVSVLPPLAALPVDTVLCGRGQRWVWDEVSFEVLHPAPGDSYDGNDSSCVLRVEAGGQTVLIPGDIEVEAENRLLQAYGAKLNSDILVAPHHGSQTSSTRLFLAAVTPSVVVYPAGYRSQFRHPAPVVADRYRAIGAAPFNVALSGALQWETGHPVTPFIREYRLVEPRYWYSPVSPEAAVLHGL